MSRFGILLLWMLATTPPMVGQTTVRKVALPDVFLITIDTLRADHVRCYGYDKIETPAIDSLAKDGIRFSHAFTPSPITNTSHTTILTGLMPSVHGVADFAIPLATDHPTWAELLSAQGYHPAAFIGAVILDSKSLAPGLDRGFDFYDNFPEHSKTRSHWGRIERRGMDVVEHAKAWLTAHPRGPHFVWVHLYDPHDPYEPPPPYSSTYKDRLYDGEIAYADSALGNLIAYLKARNWYQNALIIVVGDHGEGLGEHREATHGIFLYDATLHVPMIFKLPARTSAAKVVDAQVRTTDILPTVLDLIGTQIPKLNGESLRPFFNSEGSTRIALGETDYPQRFGWAPLRSVRTETFKFIEAPRPELYDLRADPAELHNNYADGNADVARSRALLAELPAKLPAAAAQVDSAAGGTSTSEASPVPDPKDKIEEQNLLHAALIASENDQPAEARKALEKVIEMDPKSPVALRQLGELEIDAGDYAQASNHLKSANQFHPGDATVAYHLGQALFKLGDAPGARDALESSLKTAPAQIPARILLGNVYLQLKDTDAAQDQFEAVLLSEPDNAEAKAGIAKINGARK